MKCEPCGFQTKPDNMPSLLTHLETCQQTDLNKMKIVWRNRELTVTYKNKKNEVEFPDKPRRLPEPEVPPIMVPVTSTPNVQQISNPSGGKTA
jgi:hypothetical protein